MIVSSHFGLSAGLWLSIHCISLIFTTYILNEIHRPSMNAVVYHGNQARNQTNIYETHFSVSLGFSHFGFENRTLVLFVPLSEFLGLPFDKEFVQRNRQTTIGEEQLSCVLGLNSHSKG